MTADTITLEFASRGPAVKAVIAHGTGLDGTVYVGVLRREEPRPGFGRGWWAELWPAPSGDPEAPAANPARLRCGQEKRLERELREKLRREGPWWA